MKKPSRFMPKFQHEPTGMLGWLFIAVLLAAFLWFVWKVPYVLAIVPVLLVVEYKNRKGRQAHFKSLLKNREGHSICTFARHFECRDIDTWVIRAVYEQLQNYMSSDHPNFPVLASDDIYNDLLIDDEDFEFDIVEEIAERTGRTLDGLESNSYYGKANIVENLVFLFNEQPLREQT